jgi:hypothetical protein
MGAFNVINVDHLFLGTAADNAHDRDMKGRTRNGPGKLTEADVEMIYKLKVLGCRQYAIASVLGLSSSTVSSILKKKHRLNRRL